MLLMMHVHKLSRHHASCYAETTQTRKAAPGLAQAVCQRTPAAACGTGTSRVPCVTGDLAICNIGSSLQYVALLLAITCSAAA